MPPLCDHNACTVGRSTSPPEREAQDLLGLGATERADVESLDEAVLPHHRQGLGPFEVVAHGHDDERRAQRRQSMHERGRQLVEMVGVVDHHGEAPVDGPGREGPLEREPQRVFGNAGRVAGFQEMAERAEGDRGHARRGAEPQRRGAGSRAAADDLVREPGAADAGGAAQAHAARARGARLVGRGELALAPDERPVTPQHVPMLERDLRIRY